MPGGARGYLYLLLHIAALWLLSVGLTFDADRAAGGISAGRTMRDLFVGLSSLDSRSWLPPVRITSALCCYVLIYIGIGAMLSRWLRSVVVDAKSAHLRVLTFFVFGAGLIGPLIPRMIDPRAWRSYSLIEVSNPFQTYEAINGSQVEFGRAMPILIAATVIVVLLNLRAMYRGVREIVAGGSAPAPLPPTQNASGTLTLPQQAAH
jgi:hypothetical protein